MTKKEFLKQFKQDKEELGIDLPDEELWVCVECGSLDIEETYWININNNQVTDSTNEVRYFCNQCNSMKQFSPITKQAFLNNLNN